MRIELAIDRVVLDGVGLAPGQARAVREALHAELARRITATPGSWQRSRRERLLGAPALRFDPASGPAALGRSLARSIHCGLTGEGR
ncbi:hypothetical protein [Amycolatopsis anabasis]|uniref:hypothetical protein n=1 Tax=Amycolatopsis anabasis TaxID=1840409 RepID=UPI00131BCF3B|nr:hypothetical protein [Amycolatopsis anabasis]